MATTVGKRTQGKVVKQRLAMAEDPPAFLVDARTLACRKDRNTALTYAADRPGDYAKDTGVDPKAMVRRAKSTLILDHLGHGKCSDCGAPRPELPPEERFMVHPGMALCICRMPTRKKDHTYIPCWNTPNGHEELIKACLEDRTLQPDAPVYQSAECVKCKTGPILVNVESVLRQILRPQPQTSRFQEVRLKTICVVCGFNQRRKDDAALARKRAALMQRAPRIAQQIESPKNGPEGKFKRSHSKKNRISKPQGAAIEIVSFPPLDALLEAPKAPTTE